jgi:hypothetical protein
MRRRLTDAQMMDRLDALLAERQEAVRRTLVLSALAGGVALVMWLLSRATGAPDPLLWGISWGLVQAGLVGHGVLAISSVDRRARDVIGQSETFARLERQIK